MLPSNAWMITAQQPFQCPVSIPCRELSAAEEAYAAKQRLVEGYGAEQKEAQMAQLTQQLAELKDKRDACNRVRVHPRVCVHVSE